MERFVWIVNKSKYEFATNDFFTSCIYLIDVREKLRFTSINL